MNTRGPLAGVRVVDLSIALTGPLACTLLADQGADVVKVERPGIGDIARWIGVSVGGMSAMFVAGNRGKRSIVVDMQGDEGRDIVRRLAREADVLVQNFRPGVIERLGLGYEDLRKENDRLIFVSISGFGPTGPYAGKGAYDTVIQAYGGLAMNQSDPETGEPVFLHQVIADKVTALTAVQAITAALYARDHGAGGQHVELSMLDAVVSFLWADSAGNEVLIDADGSQASSFVAALKPLCFTDGWGVVNPTSDADFAGMCRAFGVEGADDPRVATISERMRNRELSRDLVKQCYDIASGLTTAEAMERLDAERVPCGVILSPAELIDDPQARAMGLFLESEHPIAGRVRLPRHAAQFGGTPAEHGSPAPGLGQHSDEIMVELGLGDQIAELRQAGILA